MATLVTTLGMGNESLYRLNQSTVDLDTDTAPQQLDREHQQTLFRFRFQQDSFRIRQWSAHHPHALASAQIGMRERRQVGIYEFLDRFDLTVGNRCQAVPLFAEYAHQAPGLAYLQ